MLPFCTWLSPTWLLSGFLTCHGRDVVGQNWVIECPHVKPSPVLSNIQKFKSYNQKCWLNFPHTAAVGQWKMFALGMLCELSRLYMCLLASSYWKIAQRFIQDYCHVRGQFMITWCSSSSKCPTQFWTLRFPWYQYSNPQLWLGSLTNQRPTSLIFN